MKVNIAIIITVGTKYPETLSAIFAIGAFVLLASITALTISDIVDSFPIFSALYSIYPSKFILPAMTLSFLLLLVGLLSPVINASSKCAIPSVISPSTAIFSPGLLITISPLCISSKVTCFSIPLTFITALLGVISTSF